MLKELLSVTNMQKCAGLLIMACLFVCLSFNSTLPLTRDLSNFSHSYPNLSQRYDLIGRTKKMASNLESTLRRIKDSTQDFGKSIYHLNTGIKTMSNKDAITEDELRQYEELVIMKKYPYLDLKALEMKYSPLPGKNTRQSEIFAVDRNLQNEPGIHCGAAEDLLNVEIINRGLSGFAIPPHLAKHTGSADSKFINNVARKTNNADEDAPPKVFIPLDPNILKSLKDDINTYVERKYYTE